MPFPGKSEPMESNHIHAGYKPVALPMIYVPKWYWKQTPELPICGIEPPAQAIRTGTPHVFNTVCDLKTTRTYLKRKYRPLYFHHTMSFSVDYRNYHHIQLSKMTQVFQLFAIAICKHSLWVTAVIRIELISLA